MHVDVVIVGAGLSGVGAAARLSTSRPRDSYVILESRDAIGGTWDLFRYPGVRSDSDMYTLGYSFRPWTSPKAIADGPSILAYVRDTARAYGIEDKIRYGHKVVRASWNGDDARWTVEAETPDGPRTFTCRFLYGCAGYYRYDEGYTPDLPGIAEFRGTVVHPQHWPADLDYTGKNVVVIGSGATAVTLVPSMAPDAAHVTMLQRSPSYVLSLPEKDPVARLLRRVPDKLSYPVLRWKAVLLTVLSYQLARRAPKLMKKLLRKGVTAALPEDYDVDAHFTPRYDPWDQRLCFVPDGDLFTALRSGKAEIATDRIDTFTAGGVRLASGRELQADVVVTATGLNLLVNGGIQLVVDGREVRLPDTVAYKGMMLSGVPNFAFTVGYTNASWTLKADLISQYVCRLLDHLDATGASVVTPVAPSSGTLSPLIDLQSGYVLRSLDDLPKQGPEAPWRLRQNYFRDILMIRRGPVEDEGVRFSSPVRRRQDDLSSSPRT